MTKADLITFGYDKPACFARGLARPDWSMNAIETPLGWRMEDIYAQQWGDGNRRYITREEAIQQLLDD